MNKKEEISINLNIIIEKETLDEENKNSFTFNSSKKVIKFQNYSTLENLYLNIKEDKIMEKHFINEIMYYLVSTITHIYEHSFNYSTNFRTHSSACLLFSYFLLKNNFKKEFLEALKDRKKLYSDRIIYIFYNLIKLNEINFSENELIYLKSILPNITYGDSYEENYLSLLSKEVTNLRFNILDNNLKNINIEINQDKQQVIEKNKNLNFSPQYNLLLIEIDDYIGGNQVTPISAAIGNLRSYFQMKLEEMSKKIIAIDKDELPQAIKNESKIGRIRRYLKQKLELSDEDNRFINSFIDILHHEGGHSFISEKEYFRLARNIAIEIDLLLLSKYERLYVKTKK